MTAGTRSSAPPSGRRLAEVDILRGFALFGILITNAIVATTLWSVVGTRDKPVSVFDGTVDQVVRASVDALFTGRFYLLFAFLFGYSFTLQIAAAERAGVAPTRRLLRRCGALFGIGLLHVYFLWIGDILTLYAVLCLLLIALRKKKARTAIVTAVVLYTLWSVWAFLPGSDVGILGLGEFFDLPKLSADYTGGFADTFAAQTAIAPIWLFLIWFSQGLPSLAMFLLGMTAGNRKLFEDPETLRRWGSRAMLIGFGLGVPISAMTFGQLMHWWDPPLLHGAQYLVAPAMTFAYLAAILRLAHLPRTGRYLALLAPAGRMAATNYIGQSVVLMIVYTGYGFALADDLPPLAVIGVALLTFAAQLAFSARWLRGHAYGPVEWVLRAATYRTIPAWRRPAEPVAAHGG
ncbi:DUF418 domain-containing protein [Nocardia asteroides]|uniref:DUF418 domain-containing protein n=1 Tax=Nocardia asteroides TaxID=1824 RepID=UPI001E38D70E|nr:DUF418 domain-containing protein [Nocardia asteroides]UGT56287.1 DUF418 domain-containing protein [Nocardia asteroides]